MSDRKGILVVDDTVSALRLLASTLTAEGYDVRPSTSGPAALQSVQAQQPELILLDVRMPEMDGFEVCRQLKTAECSRDIPVLFLSATTDPEERVRGFELGAVDFISKPFQRDELLARVRTHLELSRLQTKLEDQVNARTEELHRTNEQLQLELAERRRAETALRASEEKFSKAFHCSPLIMAIITSSDRKLVDANKTFELCTDYTRTELSEMSSASVIWADQTAADRFFEKVTADSGCYDLDFRFKTKCGEVREGRLSAEQVEVAGTDCVLIVAEDITERNILEDQLRQAQKLEAVGRLAGGVAHDFNNIVSAMLLCLNEIRDETLSPEEQQSGLKELELEARRAASITRQLLLFSRRQRVNARMLDLNEVIRSMMGLLTRLMREDVEVTFESSSPKVLINGDWGMLEQVVMNFCINARDAMDYGGKIEIATRYVQIDSEAGETHPSSRPGDFACLSVTDHGHGMDQATLQRIFEPFFTTKEVGKGTGLGLATVFGIVKQHQGWVQVKSTPGQGSVFEVYLPRAYETQESAQTEECDIRGGSETVLVVEDEYSVRRGMVLGLRKLGYAVLEAGDANQALKVWAERGPRIDLLITDMVMPGGLSGVELAKRFTSEKKTLKVIISSGYAATLSNSDALDSLGYGALAKPYDGLVLARAVRSNLDQSPKHAPAQPI